MKLGLHIGYWGLGLTAPQQLELVLEAERLGYDCVWTAEAYGSDAATILAWLAQATSTIKLGSAIFQMPGRSRGDDGDDGGDDRPALRRADAARDRLERPAGGRGLARAAVRPPAAAHARVRGGRADGAGARAGALRRRDAAAPAARRAGQGAEADDRAGAGADPHDARRPQAGRDPARHGARRTRRSRARASSSTARSAPASSAQGRAGAGPGRHPRDRAQGGRQARGRSSCPTASRRATRSRRAACSTRASPTRSTRSSRAWSRTAPASARCSTHGSRWPARPAPPRTTATPGSSAGRREYTVAVWVGYPKKFQPMKTEFQGQPVAGGTFPARHLEDVHGVRAQDRPAAGAQEARTPEIVPGATAAASRGPGRPGRADDPAPGACRRRAAAATARLHASRPAQHPGAARPSRRTTAGSARRRHAAVRRRRGARRAGPPAPTDRGRNRLSLRPTSAAEAG